MATRKDNGQGSIYFNEKKGYWYATIQWTDSSGKKRKKDFSGKTKAAVKKKLDEFKKELLLSGPDLGKKSVTFKEFADNWLKTKLKISLKPSSFMRKEVTFINQVYPYLGSIPIEDITSADIQNMVNSLLTAGLSYSTIKKAYDNVNGCLKEYRIVTKKTSLFNPCEAVVLPTVKKRPESDIVFYKEDEIAKIKAEALRMWSNGEPVYYHGLSIVILMFSGLRVGEYLALDWGKDIDFTDGIINVNGNTVLVKAEDGAKTKYELLDQRSAKTEDGSRPVPMTKVARECLMELRKRNPSAKYVATTKSGTRVSARNLSRTLNSILKRLGMLEKEDWSGNLHALRHTFASMLFANDTPVKTVSEILGHADTKVTENI